MKRYEILIKEYFCFMLLLMCSVFIMYKVIIWDYDRTHKPEKQTTEENTYIIDSVSYDCTAENIYKYAKQCGIKYPEIVVCQAMIETGNLTSSLYKKHNNLFGMTVSGNRISTNINRKGKYASYEDWKYSVIDYGILQMKYADTSSEEAYLNWIEKSYAEDSKYILKILLVRDKIFNKNN